MFLHPKTPSHRWTYALCPTCTSIVDVLAFSAEGTSILTRDLSRESGLRKFPRNAPETHQFLPPWIMGRRNLWWSIWGGNTKKSYWIQIHWWQLTTRTIFMFIQCSYNVHPMFCRRIEVELWSVQHVTDLFFVVLLGLCPRIKFGALLLLLHRQPSISRSDLNSQFPSIPSS